jgi:outer membrane protein OmpA-like peptidoglycan-associated protein
MEKEKYTYSLFLAIALNFESLKLPAPAQLVSYAASTSPEVPLKIQIFHLSTRDMGADGETIIGEAIRTSLQSPKAQVVLERISPLLTTLQFEANQTKLQPDQTQSLDAIAKLLQEYPKLGLDITVNQAV